MTDLAKETIARLIVEYMNSILPEIKNAILAGTHDGMDENEFYTQTLLNAIRVSTELSVNLALSTLESAGVLHLVSDEKELRKLLLRPVEKK